MLLDGSKDQVNALRHFIGAAVGWGGLPEAEACRVQQAAFDGVATWPRLLPLDWRPMNKTIPTP